MRHSLKLIFSLGCASLMWAEMPAGAGLQETVRVCGRCHSPEQAASVRQGRSAWEETISKMVNMGAEGSDTEYEAIAAYLTKNFGPEKPQPVNINKASAVELESAFSFSRAEAKAVVEHRTANGNFKTVDDLKAVPGLDAKKVEAGKARIAF